jgi:hypothetical protein
MIRSIDTRPNDIRPNDIRPHDIRPHDIRPNDIRSNGTRSNGIRSNGIRSNGIRANDVRANDVRSRDPFRPRRGRARCRFESARAVLAVGLVVAAMAATALSSAAIAAPGSQPAVAIPNTRKSIGAWVSCTGSGDDTAGVEKAFAAARNGAFTLLVDCPVRVHSGLAVDRSVFIDNGTAVEFTANGKFIVDNMFHPAFVIANSSNIALLDWNVEWVGSVPIDPNFGGYELNGKFVSSPGKTQPAGAFNDLVLTKWLAANRGVDFIETQGWVKSIWVGGVNPSAVFFITGDSGNVVFSGMKIHVPAGAGGSEFMPMAFSLSANWKSNQSVTGKTPETTQFAALPHQLTFTGIDLDGTLMGWQGNVRDALFENITSHRYGDLQDASGGTSGGAGKWFPPPHLFYINTQAADPGLDNVNLHFTNITDQGIRVGTARDKGAGDSVSGYANSLKLGCTECSVDNYTSHRPDGFMDVLKADGLTVSNVTATFDSSFINNAFPAALRFPSGPYARLTFDNVQMSDMAAATVHGPIGNSTSAANTEIVFSRFEVTMNKWAGTDLPLPTITGANSNVAIGFVMIAPGLKVSYLEKGPTTIVLKGAPANVRAGGSATLSWTTRDVSACTAAGAWSGAAGPSGTRTVNVGTAGNHDFDLSCQGSSGAANASLRMVAQ